MFVAVVSIFSAPGETFVVSQVRLPHPRSAAHIFRDYNPPPPRHMRLTRSILTGGLASSVTETYDTACQTEDNYKKQGRAINLFHRHYLPYNFPSNKEIKQTNSQLQRLQKEGVWIVDVSSLARRSFTRHGQHLNGHGKAALCANILSKIKSLGREQDEPLDDAQSRVFNDAREEHSLLNDTPEPTSVTLKFDSYADVVRSASLSRSSSGEKQLLEPSLQVADDVEWKPTPNIGDWRVSTWERDDEVPTDQIHFLEVV
ncbi:hypothetical protein J6590_066625 [Homalodisca vitripennis]|nr:hypothetical protein J6590_066625 [Homalodisca vitripennis]